MQPTTHASFSVACTDHRILPESRSSAMTASVFFAAGVVYASPVPTYSAWRFGSMVGALQIPPPAGAQRLVPFAFLETIFGISAMVQVFQTCLPVAASRATTLPRKLQQGYVGLELAPSSPDATGT